MRRPRRAGLVRSRKTTKHAVSPVTETSNSLREQASTSVWPWKVDDKSITCFRNLDQTYIDYLADAWAELDESTGGEDPEDDGPEDDGPEDDGPEDDGPEYKAECKDEPPDNGKAHQDMKKDPSIARVFMRNNRYQSGEESRWHPGNRTVEEFCDHVLFEHLESSDTSSLPFALLEQSSRDEEYRESRGPLNWCQLLAALQEPRYPLTPKQTASQPPYSSNSSEHSMPTDLLPNADQRLLYIHNITSYAAAVLMRTASGYEPFVVQNLLFGHLKRQPNIDIWFPSGGVESFAFYLGLPFYTVLQRGSHITDERRMGKDPLRKTISIPGIGDFREAQVSIAVAGADNMRWTTFALVDDTNNTSSVRNCAANVPDRVRYDPIAGKPMLLGVNARMYFLWVWSLRLAPVVRCWDVVVDVIGEAVQRKLGQDADLRNLKSSDMKIDTIKASADTASMWGCKLSILKSQLSDIVQNWRKFRENDIACLQDMLQSQDIRRTDRNYYAIGGGYAKLGVHLKKLGCLIKDLLASESQLRERLTTEIDERKERTAQEVAEKQHLLAEDGAKLQRQSTECSRNANVTSMTFLPLMVAFTLFSMERSAMPLAPNLPMLLLILVIFGTVTVVTFNCNLFILKTGGSLCQLFRDFLIYLLSTRVLQPENDRGAVFSPGEMAGAVLAPPPQAWIRNTDAVQGGVFPKHDAHDFIHGG